MDACAHVGPRARRVVPGACRGAGEEGRANLLLLLIFGRLGRLLEAGRLGCGLVVRVSVGVRVRVAMRVVVSAAARRRLRRRDECFVKVLQERELGAVEQRRVPRHFGYKRLRIRHEVLDGHDAAEMSPLAQSGPDDFDWKEMASPCLRTRCATEDELRRARGRLLIQIEGRYIVCASYDSTMRTALPRTRLPRHLRERTSSRIRVPFVVAARPAIQLRASPPLARLIRSIRARMPTSHSIARYHSCAP
jgi:hypothetical protein